MINLLFIQDVVNNVSDADKSLFLDINSIHNLFLDNFMYLFSNKLIWVPMYLAFTILIFGSMKLKTALFCLLGLILVIVFTDQMTASVIRPFVRRIRPANVENPISSMVHIVNGYRGGQFSFPSAHAANSAGFFFFILYLFRSYILSFFLFFWMLVTCYSRIYLGVHYPGDTLGGIFVGFIGAIVIYFLYKLFIKSKTEPQKKLLYLPLFIGSMLIVGITIYSLAKI